MISISGKGSFNLATIKPKLKLTFFLTDYVLRRQTATNVSMNT
jgi:hypothetical protein